MKLLFPLAVVLAVVSGIPVQQTAEERQALLQAEKISIRGEEFPEQGHIVQEDPQPATGQSPVVQEEPQPAAEQSPVEQEEPQPAAGQSPVEQEEPQPAAGQSPVVQEEPQPAAEQSPVEQEEPQPAAGQSPVVQEEPQPAAEQSPVVQAGQSPVVQEETDYGSLQEDQTMEYDSPLGEDQWDGTVMENRMQEGSMMKEGIEEEPVVGEGLEELPADEYLQEDEIMNDDAALEEEVWEGPVIEKQLGTEPMNKERQRGRAVMHPIVGGSESLQRLAEREELPQRRTTEKNDMVQQEPLMEEWPIVGDDQWERPVKGVEPLGLEPYLASPEGEAMQRRAMETEENPALAKDMSHIGGQACGGVVIRGKCYQFFRGPKKAADAEFYCQDHFPDGHLASVSSRYIHLQMMVLMAKNGGYTRTWIGGFNYLKTGRFLWLDGSSWGYADWLPGEPNFTANVEDCVELLSNGKFNDMPCWDLRAFICSYPV
ncbi:hypothetical protein AGOR_G00217440 [Albula goreensis]|uniref:C-type lectin domain-containing protein n=1 Tax=Albula goreensis TaxID=1534307 RepID=A0A8T3CMH8_9TELE|nr:hypothetical protein AGOR_G00217440 [Albula goreensis]